VAARFVSEKILEISQVSEEIFRGDRLPILHVPNSTPQNLDAEE
jgi:hypothetical protein